MACVGGTRLTELEFVQRLNDHPVEACLGPAVQLLMAGYHSGLLEEALEDLPEHEQLWDNFLPADHDYLAFEMCAFHWMNLCRQLRTRGLAFDRHDWVILSSGMLAKVSRGAALDPKEISNMFIWRRTSLT